MNYYNPQSQNVEGQVNSSAKTHTPRVPLTTSIKPTAAQASMLESMLYGAAQGATLGFSDEVWAKGKELFGYGNYQDNVAKNRAAIDGAKDDNPIIYNSADIIASIVTPYFGHVGRAANIGRIAYNAAKAVNAAAKAGKAAQAAKVMKATKAITAGKASGVAEGLNNAHNAVSKAGKSLKFQSALVEEIGKGAIEGYGTYVPTREKTDSEITGIIKNVVVGVVGGGVGSGIAKGSGHLVSKASKPLKKTFGNYKKKHPNVDATVESILDVIKDKPIKTKTKQNIDYEKLQSLNLAPLLIEGVKKMPASLKTRKTAEDVVAKEVGHLLNAKAAKPAADDYLKGAINRSIERVKKIIDAPAKQTLPSYYGDPFA